MMNDIDEDEDDGLIADERRLILGDDLAGRLDKVLAMLCPDLSRTRIKALIEAGEVSVNERPCRTASTQVRGGAVIGLRLPPPVESIPAPEAIPLDVVYEDDQLIVINKPAGLVVHPGAGNPSGTLVNALLHHCGDSLSGIGGVLRPGIVHRLDKDTSGLMLAAKSDIAHRGLAAQLADRSLHRLYKAAVWRVPVPLAGKVDISIGRHPSQRQKMAAGVRHGKEAVTHYKVLERYGEMASLVECRLESGRTHQVRVHMAHLGYPLLGDPFYGLQTNAARALIKRQEASEEVTEAIMAFPRQALHAWKISFIHPVSNQVMAFESNLPEDMHNLIINLESIA